MKMDDGSDKANQKAGHAEHCKCCEACSSSNAAFFFLNSMKVTVLESVLDMIDNEDQCYCKMEIHVIIYQK